MRELIAFVAVLLWQTIVLGQLPPLDETDVAEQMLTESNRIRAASGKPPQTLDQRLCQAAQDQANYCASTGYFDHYVNGNPRRRAAKYGFPVQDENSLDSVKENLAGNFHSVPNAFSGWQRSSGHYATMLEDRPLCGFGMATGRSGNVFCAVYGNDHPNSHGAGRVLPFASPARVVTYQQVRGCGSMQYQRRGPLRRLFGR